MNFVFFSENHLGKTQFTLINQINGQFMKIQGVDNKIFKDFFEFLHQKITF